MCQNNKSGCLHFRRLFNGPFINRIVHANLINNVKYYIPHYYILNTIYSSTERPEKLFVQKDFKYTVQYTLVWLSAGLTPIELFAK